MNTTQNKTEHNQDEITESKRATKNILIITSIILWFISLPMVGFHADADYFGLFILLLAPLAWIGLPAGLAVYANLFYWWVGFVLSIEKKPDFSVLLMIGLASLTFFLRGVPLGNGDTATVYAWGHGAFVWGFAIILMAGAVWDTRPFYSIKRTLAPYFITFLVILLALFGLKYWQWSNANTDERERYFPFGSAFGVFIPSGIPYNPPPTLSDNDVPIEVVGDLQKRYKIHLKAGEVRFSLPDMFIYQGYLVDIREQELVFTPTNIKAKYRYQVNAIDNNRGKQYLYDNRTNKVIWESELKFYDGRYKKDKYPDFDYDIARLFNAPKWEYIPPENPKYSSFGTQCPIQPIPDGLKHLDFLNEDFLHLDNQIRFFIFEKYKNLGLFCNDDFVLKIEITKPQQFDFRVYVQIYRRNDLREITRFYSPQNNTNSNNYSLLEQYEEDLINTIQHIELKENQVIIKYPTGQVVFYK